MTELEKLQKEVWDYEDITADSLYDLEQAQMALNDLLNEYQWNYEPTPQMALNHGNAIHGGTEWEKRAWKYMYDYKRIMWLVCVSRDYCTLALERCKNAYYGGVANE